MGTLPLPCLEGPNSREVVSQPSRGEPRPHRVELQPHHQQLQNRSQYLGAAIDGPVETVLSGTRAVTAALPVMRQSRLPAGNLLQALGCRHGLRDSHFGSEDHRTGHRRRPTDSRSSTGDRLIGLGDRSSGSENSGDPLPTRSCIAVSLCFISTTTLPKSHQMRKGTEGKGWRHRRGFEGTQGMIWKVRVKIRKRSQRRSQSKSLLLNSKTTSPCRATKAAQRDENVAKIPQPKLSVNSRSGRSTAYCKASDSDDSPMKMVRSIMHFLCRIFWSALELCVFQARIGTSVEWIESSMAKNVRRPREVEHSERRTRLQIGETTRQLDKSKVAYNHALHEDVSLLKGFLLHSQL